MTMIVGLGAVSAALVAATSARQEDFPAGAKVLPEEVQRRRAEISEPEEAVRQETRQQRRARERREAKAARHEAKRAAWYAKRWPLAKGFVMDTDAGPKVMLNGEQVDL